MFREAEDIITTLTTAGHTAYIAGGAVRDMLLDRPSDDIDIATSATPEEVAALFPRTKPLGSDYGVTLVIENGHAFEVTTFRGEADYDGRRPRTVFFTTAEEDAKRRDFTVNGLFYDLKKKKVLDFVGGQHDLKLKIIRFIGDPTARVTEDHLRLLRAVRFRNLLDFEYEPATARAIETSADCVKNISAERVRDEMMKMLAHENRAAAVRDLDRFGLLEIILPELTKLKTVDQPPRWHREGTAFTHSLGSLAALPPDIDSATAIATLLHDLGKAETAACKIENHDLTFPRHAEESAQLARAICERWKMDRATTEKICWLVGQHMTLGSIPKMRPAHRHRLFTHPWFGELMQLFLADIRGTEPTDESLYREVEKLYQTDHDAKLLVAPTLLLTSEEIMKELDLPPGPELGRLKQLLYDAQVEGAVTSRAEAIAFLKKELNV